MVKEAPQYLGLLLGFTADGLAKLGQVMTSACVVLCVKRFGMNIFFSDLCSFLSPPKQGDKLESDFAVVDLEMWGPELPPCCCLPSW